MKKTALSVLALTLSALYSITPLLIRQEFAFGGDVAYHINWAQQVSVSISEGVLYPRWLAESNGGYGSPTTIFYSPMFYWITAIVNLFIPSLIVSLKAVTFAGFLMSGISMYILLRNFCGHWTSVAGGIAYQLLPYHIFDLYWRGTLAETFSFFWLPLILHFAYKGFMENSISSWVGFAFSYAGLVLTHIPTAYIFTFIIAVHALFLSIKGRSYKILLKAVLSILAGLSLSAFYFIPMVVERRFVHIEWLTEVGFGDYKRNFLFLPERRGDPFNTQLEFIVLLLILTVISLTHLRYLMRKLCSDLPDTPYLPFSILFALSLFVTTPFSMPLWKIIPELQTIQFPWRWLLVSTLAVSFLIGLSLDTFSFANVKKDRLTMISASMFCGLLIANIYLSSRSIFTAEPVQKKDMEWILKRGGDVIEYRPIWLTDKKKDFSSEKWTPVVFKEGEGTIDVVSWGSHSRRFTVNASIRSALRVSTFYYPGWSALINGREIPIDIEKDSGAMLLNLPAGRNEVLLEFRDTPLRRGVKWISVVSLLAAFIGLIAAKRNRMALF